MDMQKNFRRENLDLRTHSIDDAGDGRQGTASASRKAMVDLGAGCGQRLFLGSGDFREMKVGPGPGQNVACRGNSHRKGVIFPLHTPISERLEQFGMDRTGEEMKDQLFDPGPGKLGIHAAIITHAFCGTMADSAERFAAGIFRPATGQRLRSGLCVSCVSTSRRRTSVSRSA